MTWDDSLGNMRTLDQWRRSVGLSFDEEKWDALGTPVSRQPLRVRPDHRMKYGSVVGIHKPISRLVMGSMMLNVNDMPYVCALLDYFVEIGGTAIDTAWVYGGGQSERAVGQWMQLRSNREQLVIIGKGAHTPHCDVAGINRQLPETLERLQTDYVDLYLLHRDNPEVPVGEFVECLNEHLTSRTHPSVWRVELVARTPASGERLRCRPRLGRLCCQQSQLQPRRLERAAVGRLHYGF